MISSIIEVNTNQLREALPTHKKRKSPKSVSCHFTITLESRTALVEPMRANVILIPFTIIIM